MEIIYASAKVQSYCTDLIEAKKFFVGDNNLAISLFSRINSIKQAKNIKDIIALKTHHFHKLTNKDGKNLEGYFAIDVKSRKEPFVPCHIDEIAEIKEVSKHYE